MSETELSEVCPCGGSFTVKGTADTARDALKAWRGRHPAAHVAGSFARPSGATSGDISLRVPDTATQRLPHGLPGAP